MRALARFLPGGVAIEIRRGATEATYRGSSKLRRPDRREACRTCNRWVYLPGVLRRALLATALSFLPATAYGNGRFPQAQEFHQAPGSNSELMVVRATFGLIVSVDRGQRWEYWCEDALQYSDGYDPPLTYTANGTLLVALDNGLLSTRDGCSVRRQPDLESLSVKDIASSPDGRVTWAIAVTRSIRPDSRVARSTDQGLTFEFVGDRFEGVMLETIEVAGSDPLRLYATGTLTSDGTAVLFRTVDGGVRWVRASAGFGEASGVYVSGVDGHRPEVVYLRATAAGRDMDAGPAGSADVLFRSDDGGETLREVLRTRGPMRGFGLSDDGRRVWAGGPEDGVWRSIDGAAPTRFSDEPVDCLRWSSGALWACRVFTLGGPLLLRSDGDSAFVTALSAPEVGGPPVRCPTGTVASGVCPSRWSVVRRSLVQPAAIDASTDQGAAVTQPSSAGHGCHAGPGAQGAWSAFVGFAVAAIGRRRRTRTLRSRPDG